MHSTRLLRRFIRVHIILVHMESQSIVDLFGYYSTTQLIRQVTQDCWVRNTRRKTHWYATTGATRCPALMLGISTDTLLYTISRGGHIAVDRPNTLIEISNLVDPRAIAARLPPLPVTFTPRTWDAFDILVQALACAQL